MLEILDLQKDNLIATKLEGKVTKNDVDKIHKLMHKIIEKGDKVDFYFEMNEFKGYTLEGFLEDIKIDISHHSDYGKIAFVGEKKWQEWAAKATDFFTSSEVKYFVIADKNQAISWISK